MNEQEIIKQNLNENKNVEADVDMALKFEELKKESEDRLNQLKYMQADFDNLRKHFEKDKISVVKFANENLIEELIVVLDDFESSIKMITDQKSKDGMQRIYKKFFNILTKYGLSEIESVGKKLDPHKHEAIIKEASEKDDGEVIEELQKGYSLNSKVIRTSKVKVAEKFKNDDKKINNSINEGEQNG